LYCELTVRQNWFTRQSGFESTGILFHSVITEPVAQH
jgi:hypothetical protein